MSGPLLAGGIARLGGSSYVSLGGGVDSGEVRAVAMFPPGPQESLYVAGSFTKIGGVNANYIAKWDGSTWSPLGTGTNVPINAMAVYDDGAGPGLYAACDFFMAGGVSANRVAKWDGLAWHPIGEVGGGVGSGQVHDLAVFDDGSGEALYVAGEFLYAGQSAIPYIAKWNGTAWSSLGFGVNGAVNKLDVLDDGTGPGLYLRGSFTNAGAYSANRIARWHQGGFWTPLGGGVSNGSDVNDWAVFDDGSGPKLYATGSFTSIGGVAANRIAKWNGATWSPTGSVGLNNGVGNALAVFDDGSGPAIYVGGTFTEVGGLSARRIARWNGTSWSVLWLGIEGTSVNDLAVFDDDGPGPLPPALYVGGEFTTAGGLPSANIARWDACPCVAGDMNADQVTNLADVDAFVQVLLGLDKDFWRSRRADVNRDDRADGLDIQPFVAAVFSP